MAPLAVVGALGLLAVAAAYGWLAGRETTSRIEQRLQGVVRVLEESSYPLTASVLRQMSDLAGAEFVLVNPTGAVAATSEPRLTAATLESLSQAESPTDEVTLGSGAVQTVAGRFLHTAVALDTRRGTGAPRTLHLLFPTRDYNAAWRAALLPPLAVGGLMIASTGLVVGAVAGRIGRTLDVLGATVQRLAAGEHATPPTTRWNDETRDLANSVAQAGVRMQQYEADLRRTERLRTVSMLGAGLAHEMRNATTGCRLAIDLHAEGCCPAESDDCLDVARRQLRSLEDRLRQLLQLGRQPSDTPLEVVDLSAIVREAVGVVRPSARHKRVRLDWSDHGPRPVRGRPEPLLQSVVNLLLNAVEAAARETSNLASEAFVCVELANASDQAVLRVIDSGAGPDLPPDEDCFEPFVTQKPEGVGMGLSVCRMAVEDAGGRIDWRRDGQTTVFSVSLPAALQEPHDA